MKTSTPRIRARRGSHEATDVVVVGAGPAGSAAAIACRQAGLSVVVVESSAFPRESPGETLHPGTEALWKMLSVREKVLAAAKIRHSGHWVQWEGPPRFEPFGHDADGEWTGLQVMRSDLDGILLGEAARLGADIRQPCRASEPLLGNGRVQGVATTSGRIAARFVIDAAGDTHWMARHLRLPTAKRSPKLLARFGYVQGSCPYLDDAPRLTADEQGWTWLARVGHEQYHWTRLSFASATLPREWLPEDCRGMARLGPTRGSDVTWRCVKVAAGPGYFCVGDAGAVLDPSSSHGVLRAVMSGIFAAHAITEVVSGRVPEERAAVGYSAWVENLFDRDVLKLSELYASHPAPPEWLRWGPLDIPRNKGGPCVA